MKKIRILIIAFVLVSVQMLLGVIPQKWELYRIDDYLEGKFTGISVSHEGVLSLSPKEEILEGPAGRGWSFRPDCLLFLRGDHAFVRRPPRTDIPTFEPRFFLLIVIEFFWEPRGLKF